MSTILMDKLRTLRAERLVPREGTKYLSVFGLWVLSGLPSPRVCNFLLLSGRKRPVQSSYLSAFLLRSGNFTPFAVLAIRQACLVC
jgi:hypothetical protein